MARRRAGSIAAEHRISQEQRFQHRPSFLVARRPRFRHRIQHDKRAAPEIVPALQRFAIRPHEPTHCEFCQRPERGPETIGNGEQRAVPILHRPARRVDERSPTI